MSFSCYRLSLPTTNACKDTYQISMESSLSGTKYISVEDGYLYFITDSLEALGRAFPDALEIRRLGPALLPQAGSLSRESRDKILISESSR